MALTNEQKAKLTNLEQLEKLSQRTGAWVEYLDGKIDGLDNEVVKSVGLTKDTTATAGYAASYTLSVNGTDLGTKIDIPKDWLLTSVDKGTVTAADKAAGGKFENDDDFVTGDKYIDFTFNVKAGGSETSTHIYLNVQDLVDIYLAGNGLALDSSTNTFSVVVDSNNANGLSVGANGLALGLADDSVPGAMSAADHTKLAGISAQANKVTVTTEKAGTLEIDGVPKTIVEFATNTEVENMLDDVLPAPTAASGD